MITSKNQQAENKRLIRRKEVEGRTGLGASSIYAMMKKGKFPQCLNLSERRVAWVESEVDQWIALRIENHKATIEKMGAES